MPLDTLVTLGFVAAAFAFFAGVLTYSELTWNR